MSASPPPRLQRRPSCGSRVRPTAPHRPALTGHAAFDAAADIALAAHDGARRELLESAAALWAGDPLPEDRDDERTAGWPTASAHRYVAVLGALAQACAQDCDFITAIRWGRACLALDRCNEQAHRELMVAYARAGSVAAALAQYRACRHALVARLGTPPSRQTEAIHAWLRRGATISG